MATAANITKGQTVQEEDQVQPSSEAGELKVQVSTAATEITEQTNIEQDDQVPPPPTLSICVRCEGDTAKAVVCCANCNKQFCDIHGKVSSCL